MKKLIIKGLLLFLLCAAVLVMYDRVIIKFEDSDTIRIFNNFRLVDKAKIILFGDSHCQRVKEGSDFKESIADLAMAANDVFISRKTINEIKSELNPGTIILMNVSYMSLRYKMLVDHDTIKDNFNTHLLYYSLPLNYVKKDNFSNYIGNRFFAINHVENIGRAMASAKNVFFRSKESKGEEESKNPDDTSRQMNEKWFLSKCQSHMNWMKDTKKIFPDIRQLTEKALKDIAETAKSRNCKIIFYSMPHHINFKNKYTNPVADTLSQEISELMTRNGFMYLDHFQDKKYIYSRKNFYNGDHMNLYGTRLFIKDLVEEIKTRYDIDIKY